MLLPAHRTSALNLIYDIGSVSGLQRVHDVSWLNPFVPVGLHIRSPHTWDMRSPGTFIHDLIVFLIFSDFPAWCLICFSLTGLFQLEKIRKLLNFVIYFNLNPFVFFFVFVFFKPLSYLLLCFHWFHVDIIPHPSAKTLLAIIVTWNKTIQSWIRTCHLNDQSQRASHAGSGN